MSIHTTEIAVSSSACRDQGIFLVFLGLVTSFLLPLALIYANHAHLASLCPWLGLALGAGGLLLLHLPRKRFIAQRGMLCVRDGPLRRPIRYRWETAPSVRLSMQSEEADSGHLLEFWMVELVFEDRRCELDRRLGGPMESYSLAEALARALRCPLQVPEGTADMSLAGEELGQSLRERALHHPELLVPEARKPRHTVVRYSQEADSQLYDWKLGWSNWLVICVSLVFVICLIGALPIFTASVQGELDLGSSHTAFLLGDADGDWRYFEYCFGCGMVGALGLLGYRKRLRLSPEGVYSSDYFWGLRVSQSEIPAQELKEVWVRSTSTGGVLQLLSSSRIVTVRTARMDVAAWLASQVRRFYGQPLIPATHSPQ